MKLNRKIIVSLCLVLLIGIAATIFLLFGKKENTSETNRNANEITYTAYVNINPLVKLTFKVSCKEEVCSNPVINGYELVNEDAKELFNDIDLKDQSLQDGLLLLGNTAKDKDVEFSTVEIYTNWNNNNYFEENEYTWEMNVNIINEIELNDIPKEIEEKKLVTKTLFIPEIAWRNLLPNLVPSLTSLTQGEGFTDGVVFPGIKKGVHPQFIIKIICQGEESVMNEVEGYLGNPDVNDINEILELRVNGKFPDGTKYITPYLDLTGYGIGTYKVNAKFENKVEGMEILTTAWFNVKIQERQ